MPANPDAPLSAEAVEELRTIALSVSSNGRIPSPWKSIAHEDTDTWPEVVADNNVYICETPNEDVAQYLAECSPANILALLDEVERGRGEYVRGLHEGRAKAMDEAADGEVERKLATALAEVERGKERARVGAQMANLCYNLAQHDQVTQRNAEVMRELVKQWDDILPPAPMRKPEPM